MCVRNATHSTGTFSGGECKPSPCTKGMRMPHSPTLCENVGTGQNCSYECDARYEPRGNHTCAPARVLLADCERIGPARLAAPRLCHTADGLV